MENLLAILGGLISLLLAINAFFARETLTKVTKLELSLGILLTKHDQTEERSRKNEEEITRLRDRVHELEGHAFKFMEFLNNGCSHYGDRK